MFRCSTTFAKWLNRNRPNSEITTEITITIIGTSRKIMKQESDHMVRLTLQKWHTETHLTIHITSMFGRIMDILEVGITVTFSRCANHCYSAIPTFNFIFECFI